MGEIKNDKKAWEGFKDFIKILSEYGIDDEHSELIEIQNTLAILRKRRYRNKLGGYEELVDKVERVIQRNYREAIGIIKEIQENFTQLGSGSNKAN